MKQATVTYESTYNTEAQATGAAITMLNHDLRNYNGPWEAVQVQVMGDKGAYSVEFTLNISDYFNSTFAKAEDSEVLA
jgi:hypothetical protein